MSTIEIPAALRNADKAARAALDKRARLDVEVDRLPDAIADREKALGELRARLAQAEADVAIATPADAKPLQRRADDLRVKVEGTANELTSLKRKIVGLEGVAPAIDEAVRDAHRVFESALRPYLRELTHVLAEELYAALAPGREIVAKLRALTQLGECSSFFAGMFVPDPIAYQHVSGENFALRGNRNLLDAAPDPDPDPDTAACLAPLLDTLNRLRRYRPYVLQRNRRRNTPPTDHGIRIPA